MGSNDISRLRSLYKAKLSRRSPDNYYSITKKEIPEMTTKLESENVDESLEYTTPLVLIPIDKNKNKNIFENQPFISNSSDISALSECYIDSETNPSRNCYNTNCWETPVKNSSVCDKSRRFNNSYTSDNNCSLSANDCIKKSILYTEPLRNSLENVQKIEFNFKKLPIIFSESVSSDVYCPDDDESIHEGTYSIVEELPSDNEKHFAIPEDVFLNEDRPSDIKMSMKCYPDSFDESESSQNLKQNQDVFQYLQNCLDAGEKMKNSITNIIPTKPLFEDVVGKVINQYHNLISRKNDNRKLDPARSGGNFNNSSCSGEWSTTSSIDRNENNFNVNDKIPFPEHNRYKIDSQDESLRTKLEHSNNPSGHVCSPLEEQCYIPKSEFFSPFLNSNDISNGGSSKSLDISSPYIYSTVSSISRTSISESIKNDTMYSTSNDTYSISSTDVHATLNDSFYDRFNSLYIKKASSNIDALEEIILDPPQMFRNDKFNYENKQDKSSDAAYMQPPDALNWEFDVNDITSVGSIKNLYENKVFQNDSQGNLDNTDINCRELTWKNNKAISCGRCGNVDGKFIDEVLANEIKGGKKFMSVNISSVSDKSIFAKFDISVDQMRHNANAYSTVDTSCVTCGHVCHQINEFEMLLQNELHSDNLRKTIKITKTDEKRNPDSEHQTKRLQTEKYESSKTDLLCNEINGNFIDTEKKVKSVDLDYSRSTRYLSFGNVPNVILNLDGSKNENNTFRFIQEQARPPANLGQSVLNCQFSKNLRNVHSEQTEFMNCTKKDTCVADSEFQQRNETGSTVINNGFLKNDVLQNHQIRNELHKINKDPITGLVFKINTKELTNTDANICKLTVRECRNGIDKTIFKCKSGVFNESDTSKITFFKDDIKTTKTFSSQECVDRSKNFIFEEDINTFESAISAKSNDTCTGINFRGYNIACKDHNSVFKFTASKADYDIPKNFMPKTNISLCEDGNITNSVLTDKNCTSKMSTSRNDSEISNDITSSGDEDIFKNTDFRENSSFCKNPMFECNNYVSNNTVIEDDNIVLKNISYNVPSDDSFKPATVVYNNDYHIPESITPVNDKCIFKGTTIIGNQNSTNNTSEDIGSSSGKFIYDKSILSNPKHTTDVINQEFRDTNSVNFKNTFENIKCNSQNVLDNQYCDSVAINIDSFCAEFYHNKGITSVERETCGVHENNALTNAPFQTMTCYSTNNTFLLKDNETIPLVEVITTGSHSVTRRSGIEEKVSDSIPVDFNNEIIKPVGPNHITIPKYSFMIRPPLMYDDLESGKINADTIKEDYVISCGGDKDFKDESVCAYKNISLKGSFVSTEECRKYDEMNNKQLSEKVDNSLHSQASISSQVYGKNIVTNVMRELKQLPTDNANSIVNRTDSIKCETANKLFVYDKHNTLFRDYGINYMTNNSREKESDISVSLITTNEAPNVVFKTTETSSANIALAVKKITDNNTEENTAVNESDKQKNNSSAPNSHCSFKYKISNCPISKYSYSSHDLELVADTILSFHIFSQPSIQKLDNNKSSRWVDSLDLYSSQQCTTYKNVTDEVVYTTFLRKVNVTVMTLLQCDHFLSTTISVVLQKCELQLFDLSKHMRCHNFSDIFEITSFHYESTLFTSVSSGILLYLQSSDDDLAHTLFVDESVYSNILHGNRDRDSISVEFDLLIKSDGEFDGMPNTSTRLHDIDTISNNSIRCNSCSSFNDDVARRTTDKQVSGGEEGRLTENDVPLVEHGEQHATAEALLALDNSVAYNLDECGCWKSLSSDARSDLRKWRILPTFSASEMMWSLNSSKLNLTGSVPPELYISKTRNNHLSEYVFAAPLSKCFSGIRDSLVQDLIFSVEEKCVSNTTASDLSSLCDSESTKFPSNLCVSNIEAIREFSNYFKKSLETDSKLRTGISDLSLEGNFDDNREFLVGSNVCNDAEQSPCEQNEKLNNHDHVTSFVFSSASSSSDHSDDESLPFCNEMKNKKKNVSEETSTETEDASSRPGILKSALKRSSKKFYRKKHRVQFDESLNKFFEADYVILIRDEEYDDDYERCECGNQFCYEGCYYEDGDDEEYEQSVDSPRFDFAAAFDPPMEFVDPVTLSPPDGYKDGCCPEPGHKISIATMTCGDNKDTDKDYRTTEKQEKLRNDNVNANEKVKTQDHTDDDCTAKKDLQNQGYPFQPNDADASTQLALFNDSNLPANGQSRYIVETITMTTVTERRIVHESNDKVYNNGILKGGGKQWRNQETDDVERKITENAILDTGSKLDDDKRSVKFTQEDLNDESCDKSDNYEKGEFTLTFKLGNRVVPCNSLKPNSAVRQLFPDPRFVNPPAEISEIDCDDNLGKCEGKYLITEESLRAFNEVNKRSVFATFSGKERYPYKDGNFTVHSDDEDIPQNDLIKKTIERNTLRRSLMRYPRGENRKRGNKKTQVSLEERIKQLTCNIDEEQQTAGATELKPASPDISQRITPPGEESYPDAESQPETSCKVDKSTYKKFTDLFRKPECQTSGPEQHYPYYQPVYQVMQQPDLGIDMKAQSGSLILTKKPGTNEARKQFLSSLAPLTACVTGHVEPNYGNRETLKLKLPGDRRSIISTASTSTEYSIGDIDDALNKPGEEKAPQPDIIAGTPSANSNQDELAMFVQQDAGRIERIKKRYSGTPSSTVSDEDEHDDYGFSRRPSVRGIKPRFGSTTEIIQQMQAQLQPSIIPCPTKAGSHMTWPYYSAEVIEGKTGATSPRNPLPVLKEEGYDLNKQNASDYTAKVVWEKSTLPPRGPTTISQPLKVDTACNNVHMFRFTPSDAITEVAVPYKYDGDPRRFPGNNIFQMKVSPVTSSQVRLPVNMCDGQFIAHPIPMGTTSVIRVGHGQQQTFRVPCPVSGPVQVHLLATHHYENPPIRSSQPIHFPSQIVVAKGTQTSTISTTSFYQLQTNSQGHCQNACNMNSSLCKGNTNSVEQAKLIQVNCTTAHPSPPPISSLNSSPTRVKSQNHLTERGIPEGAVCSSPAFVQDNIKIQSSMSETPNNTQQGKPNTVMYGMKV